MRALSIDGANHRSWPLLPLMVCEAISGHYEQAVPIAASLQLLLASGDVFDDIEDADSSQSLSARYGSAIATNVATTLLILAERAITRLKTRGVSDCMIIRIIDAVNSYYTIACAGQHLDLSLSLEMASSEDIYFKVTGMKSASQVECACYVGALLATENQELIDIFTIFGHNLGMAAQITNDIYGITRGSDILKQKMTLPVLYALAQTNYQAHNQLERTFVNPSESEFNPAQIKDFLFRSGAIHYATIKMEFYKLLAQGSLFKAEKAGARVEQLKLFLK
jgi:geranylgeranyl pyrophosphate synthase